MIKASETPCQKACPNRPVSTACNWASKPWLPSFSALLPFCPALPVESITRAVAAGEGVGKGVNVGSVVGSANEPSGVVAVTTIGGAFVGAPAGSSIGAAVTVVTTSLLAMVIFDTKNSE